MHNAIDTLNFLTTSSNRVAILRSLADDGSLSKGELKRRSTVSRTTLKRNLEALEERRWIQSDIETYSLTVKGEKIADDLLTLIETIGTANQIEPFLNNVPRGSLDFDLRLLKNAELTVADKGNPYAPINSHIRLMKRANFFRCVLPSVGLQAMETAWKCVKRDSEHEVILGTAATRTIRQDPVYKDPLEKLAEADNCTILKTGRDPPYYLGLTDNSIQIGVEDDGKPHALIESSNPDLVKWGEKTYHKYKSGAERFSIQSVYQDSTNDEMVRK